MSQDACLPGKIQFDRRTLPDPPPSLVAYVAELLATEYEGPQRRGSRRLPVVVPVVAMPLDNNFRPMGTTFAAITRDLSTGGLRLFSTRAANSKFLAVELTSSSDENMQVVLEVLRCKAIGRFYEIAGKLVARTDDGPA
ncbi:MAG: PilZ domain-containing protein [Thermoguttaceae bacterium]